MGVCLQVGMVFARGRERNGRLAEGWHEKFPRADQKFFEPMNL
jgi:hypothetical protein